MQCPACDARTSDDAVFCHQCGERLRSDHEATAPQRPARDTSPLGARIRPQAAADEVEVELWAGSYSGKAMLGHAVLAGLATVGLLIAGLFMSSIAYRWIGIVIVLVLMWGWLGLVVAYRKLSVSYRLTNLRLVHKSGILRRSTDRIEVIDMEDISYHQGLIERLLGIGTIRIESGDRSHPNIKLWGIAQVHDVAAKLDSARRKERLRRGIFVDTI